MANYSVIPNGTNTNPFMGPNYAPIHNNAGYDINYWGFGNTSNYPKPYQNFSWRIQNASWSLGAFCKAHQFVDNIDKICLEGSFGRLKISTKSPNLGEIGFVTQHWYEWTDGPGNILNEFPTYKEWWDNCTTFTIEVPNLMYTRSDGTRPRVLVDVAIIGRGEEDYVDATPDPGTNTGYTFEIEYSGSDEDWSNPNPPRYHGGWAGEGDDLIAGIPKMNYDLYNWIWKTYDSLPAAEWQMNNPGKPTESNPFLPPGAYVPQAALPGSDPLGSSENYLASHLDNLGYETAGLGAIEARTLIDIIKCTPRNHQASIHARGQLLQHCSPSDINKLSMMGIV